MIEHMITAKKYLNAFFENHSNIWKLSENKHSKFLRSNTLVQNESEAEAK